MSELLLLLLEDALWSGLAAMGFAILFNVPRRALPYCIVAGAVGHSFRAFLMQAGLSIELATLLSATLVGFYARTCAVRLGMPSAIFSVSGAIPMVPGAFAYRTMIAILQITTLPGELVGDTLALASVNAVKTGVILAAIAVGIAAPTLLFLRERPVV